MCQNRLQLLTAETLSCAAFLSARVLNQLTDVDAIAMFASTPNDIFVPVMSLSPNSRHESRHEALPLWAQLRRFALRKTAFSPSDHRELGRRPPDWCVLSLLILQWA
jgi:hypothetical protein